MKRWLCLSWVVGLLVGCGGDRVVERHQASEDPVATGKKLFSRPFHEGNGRTCATCHVPESEFTITPAAVEARYQADPGDDLFKPVDADDFGIDFTTLRRLGVFRVQIDLAPNVIDADDPLASVVWVWRGAPTVDNVALTAPYLNDGRAATLQAQATGAEDWHGQAYDDPPQAEVDNIAAYEMTIFSSPGVQAVAAALAAGMPPPDPDPPLNEVQAAGKVVFQARCAQCHGGPGGSTPSIKGQYHSVHVSEFNDAGLPLHHLTFTLPDGSQQTVTTPDAGRAIITGDLADLNAFDVPQLRGISRTAPYFHDNSAATLEDVIAHYQRHFAKIGRPLLSDADAAALLEYLKVI